MTTAAPVQATITELLSVPGKAPVPMRAVVALAHAIDTDRHAMSLHSMPDPYTSPVTLLPVRNDGSSEWAFGPLRYVIDHDSPTVYRLCTAPGCKGEAVSTTSLTRVCLEHLGVLVPGILPNAGDDTNDADRAAAAKESRTMRLNSWMEQITEARAELDGDERVLNSLRGDSADADES
ncbi:hypothetical protein E6R60_26615 [Streptomyces sp. A0642]|uniref:hypothetical protein n=1 Tax=Streptomyces sp. A0642 TaxID=2563100 RepID=UPI0010A20D67|nr:hypothetical protein [Streptomyces sp. A0642]THA72506.1 hypothetical protein E6R60_26615 [Streptomyces sp. A0642]